jgi:hypothetical protein
MLTPEPRVHKILRRQSVAFLITAAVSSLCLVLIGVIIEASNAVASKVIIVIGSSGLGTCFGLVFGSITGSSAIMRIKELIETSISSSLQSSEHTLEPYRKVWHSYLRTRIEGRMVWRYRMIDFSRFAPSGKLIATLTVPGTDSSMHTYYVEAYLVRSRLIIVQNAAQGSEEPVIGIYPSAGQHFRSLIAGVIYLQAWDGAQFLTAGLMSSSPLLNGKQSYPIGTLPDEVFNKLDEMWEREARMLGISADALSLQSPLIKATPTTSK